MTTSGPLGDYLRSKRASVGPADVGLPAGIGMRRTAGLRREELATLAGVSVDYYIRLEQGRERRPSTSVLRALADALRLTTDETEHLFDVAAVAGGSSRGSATPPVRSVRPSIAAILERVRPLPAYVLNRVSDVVAANPEGLDLLYGIGDVPAEQRNSVRFIFTHAPARELFVNWSETAQASVASLRAMNAHCPDDPDLLRLVEEIGAADSTFRKLWVSHAVGPRRHTRKTFNHPRRGFISFDFEVMHLLDDGLRISIYTP